MGLVIAPDLFGLRPLFDDLVAGWPSEWSMAVVRRRAVPRTDLPQELEPRMAAVAELDDDAHLGDLEAAADATGAERVGLIGFCMGGMYTLKAARSERFARLVAFYGMIRVPEKWHGPARASRSTTSAAGHPERVLAIIGERDHYTPPDDVTASRRPASPSCATRKPSTVSPTTPADPPTARTTPPTRSPAPGSG